MRSIAELRRHPRAPFFSSFLMGLYRAGGVLFCSRRRPLLKIADPLDELRRALGLC